MALLYHFRDKARYWSKIVSFDAFYAPVTGDSRRNITMFGIATRWREYEF